MDQTRDTDRINCTCTFKNARLHDFADTIKRATGAGKTTLLNVLADRVGSGVVGGYIGVGDRYKEKGFTQKIGYAQQQDLHLSTATVREALEFSALLRQPARYSRREKLEYVDTIIDLPDMEKFVESVIGVPGEGKDPDG
jgi:ATP-binding cassette, subfamily G (WHITE), member 2, PDR